MDGQKLKFLLFRPLSILVIHSLCFFDPPSTLKSLALTPLVFAVSLHQVFGPSLCPMIGDDKRPIAINDEGKTTNGRQP